jgi:uncharacterized protein YjbI with pentapeptide repeats
MRATAVVLFIVACLGVSLAAPVPKWCSRWAASVAFWRRSSIRDRWERRRRLRLAYLAMGAVATIVLVVWVLPSVLTEHPHIPKSSDRHTAIANTRTSLVAMLAAIGVAGGLAYTARTYRLSREGHITDRYSTAVEQLGSDKMAVRLGGIYALERLMRDSPADQPTITETLAAYVRQNASARPAPAPAPSVRDRRVAGRHRAGLTSAAEHPAEDVQAVLTVLGRRRPVDNEGRIDLHETNLRGAALQDADLSGAWLDSADLSGAWLYGANLTGALLGTVNLTGAELHGAKLSDAYLFGANLSGAQLSDATLTGARLDKANLTRAELIGANLTGAHLYEANLTDARLPDVNLTGAALVGANLTDAWLIGANLTGTRFGEPNLLDLGFVGANLRRAMIFTNALTPEQLADALHVDEIDWVEAPARLAWARRARPAAAVHDQRSWNI